MSGDNIVFFFLCLRDDDFLYVSAKARHDVIPLHPGVKKKL